MHYNEVRLHSAIGYVAPRVRCPLHGASLGTARSFSVNLQQQVFHCFQCGRSGNPLDLWAQATRQTPRDAALDLCRRFSLPAPKLSQNEKEEPVENPKPIS